MALMLPSFFHSFNAECHCKNLEKRGMKKKFEITKEIPSEGKKNKSMKLLLSDLKSKTKQ